MSFLPPIALRRRAVLALSAALPLLLGLPAQALENGQPAPEFRLAGQPAPVALTEQKGKVVYLDFWASWCGPCKQSFPWMAEMQKKYGPRGLQVIAVNLDAKREDADRFLAQTPAGFTVGFDATGDTPKRYGIKGMPSSVLIAANGTVLAQHSGFREDERATLEAAIVDALNRSGR